MDFSTSNQIYARSQRSRQGEIPEPYLSAYRVLQEANDRRRHDGLIRFVNERICVEWQPGRGRHGRHTCISAIEVVDKVRRFYPDYADIHQILERLIQMYYYERRPVGEIGPTREQYYAMAELNGRGRDNAALESFQREGIRVSIRPPLTVSLERMPDVVTERVVRIAPIDVFRVMDDVRAPMNPELRSFRDFVIHAEEDLERRSMAEEDGWGRENDWRNFRYYSRSGVEEAQLRYNRTHNDRIDAMMHAMNQNIGQATTPIFFTPAAQKKALELLKRVTTKDEFEQYCAVSKIFVFGKRYEYSIQKTGQTGIRLHGQDRYIYSACLQFKKESTPPEDRVVMEYLMIKNDEERYLNTANVHHMGTGTRVNARYLHTKPSVMEESYEPYDGLPVFEF